MTFFFSMIASSVGGCVTSYLRISTRLHVGMMLWLL